MPDSCDYSCIGGSDGSDLIVCEHGLSHISKVVNEVKVVVSGVYLSGSDATKKENRKYKNQKASLLHINSWFSDLELKFSVINAISNKIAKNKFDQFHEFAKWANEINFYSSRLIDKSKNNQIQGFEAATEDLKSLYKTSVMLLDSLDTSSIYYNPDSASFGNKRSTDIYSMVHKISLVLRHSKTKKGKVGIQIKGRVKNKHRVYESFKIIPLSLLQNALKYKKTNDVEVLFEECGDNLTMSIVSYGDLIYENELPKLFNRGYRASSAINGKIEGSGLGLYVVKVVADAHGFDLYVKSEIASGFNGFARNSFTVSIR